jgi:hypothetical protein
MLVTSFQNKANVPFCKFFTRVTCKNFFAPFIKVFSLKILGGSLIFFVTFFSATFFVMILISQIERDC